MSNLTKYEQTEVLLAKPEITKKLTSMLGSKKVEGFKVSVLNIMKNNSMLKDAEPTSILFAAATAASLDLPVNENLGFAYIVPFRDNKTNTVKAQFQISYRGLKQLAIRSGQFVHINETDVREGEIETRDFLTGEITFNWNQNLKERLSKKVVGYVSYFKLKSGYTSTFYMGIEEIEEHAKTYSQTYKKGYGVWKDNFDSMAKKTVSKLNLSKNAPLSIESIHNAVVRDQSVIEDIDHEEAELNYIDNPAPPTKSEAIDNQMSKMEAKITQNKPSQAAEEAEIEEEEVESSEKLKELYEAVSKSTPPRSATEKKPIWDAVKKLGLTTKEVSEHLASSNGKHKDFNDLTKEGSTEDVISVIQELI